MSVYEEMTDSQQFACRVIADHARSTAFAIADGIVPGNEGRNYVLRKIMRRAIYHGREHLGLTDPFFYKVCDFVVEEMNGAFPELETQRDFIGKMVKIEEEKFGTTLTTGLSKLDEFFKYKSDEEIEQIGAIAVQGLAKQLPDILKNLGPAVLAANEAIMKESAHQMAIIAANTMIGLAKLYDTYGIPKDLIRVSLVERGLSIEEEDFDQSVDIAVREVQKQSGIGKTERKGEVSTIYAALLEKVGANKFHGYDATQFDGAKVIGILDGEKELDKLTESSHGSVILDQTPFYAESGGQVGDSGKLIGTSDAFTRSGGDQQTSNDVTLTVSDTYSPVAGLIIHKVTVDKGTIKVGDVVTASVDVQKRDATRRNHTATHLVHAALKEVLGTHVKQAGSVVAPSYLRFDFTHYQPMSDAEISEVEDLVNRYILQNESVTTDLMKIEDAMRSGAVAMFGEKYGGEVRVLSVGDGAFSKEFCGGTHVRATGDIGSFKITSDEAIASGVRRIRAITGFDAFERFREDERLIDASLGALNTQRDNLPNAIAKLAEDLKRTRKEMDELKLKIATGAMNGGVADGDEARDINGVKVMAKIVDRLDGNGTRQLSDTLLARLKSGVVVLGRTDEGKVGIIVRVSDDLTDRVKAGNVIKEIAPIVGGRGGGKPDMAEGGGTEPDKLSEAIDAAYGVIEKMLD
ncbi:MAG: alanine--tRNA ligase-related protein [Pyrinomonadaceae bacterium]